MEPASLNEDSHSQTEAASESLAASGLLYDARLLWDELGGLIHDRFHIAALETQRAGESLVTMIVAGILAGVMLGCAWLGLVVAAILELIQTGFVASSAILLGVVFNLLLALILFNVIRRKSRYLQFPASIRSFQSTPPSSEIQ